jgi:hypothetical protein
MPDFTISEKQSLKRQERPVQHDRTLGKYCDQKQYSRKNGEYP